MIYPQPYATSNVTGGHRGDVHKSFGLVTERRHDIGVLRAITHIYPIGRRALPNNARHIFHRCQCMVSRAFSALCARYACIRRSGIILTPTGYACAKFGFVCGPHRCASPWRKIA